MLGHYSPFADNFGIISFLDQLCRCLTRVKNIVVYYELKSCIFVDVDVLLSSGRSAC